MDAAIIIAKRSFIPPAIEIDDLERKTAKFIESLRKNIKNWEIFVGGSFGKKTMINKEVHDVDIFIRMPKKQFNINKVEQATKKAAKALSYSLTTVQGSRPYFRISADNKTVFEVVPSLKISKPQEAENVIDLSYFHVSYMKRAMRKNKKLAEQIRAAKAFCMSCGVYGAESYIRGFSGYAIECLMLSYKTLIKMLKEISKAECKVILDPAKHYKNKTEILYMMNESKTSGPIILVDPTWKERNVCAAVSQESFDKLKEAATDFLSKPTIDFFKKKEFSPAEFESQTGHGTDNILVMMQTNKQEGDIAGTKLKKYANYLISELSKKLEIKNSRFQYGNGKSAELHILASPKKEILHKGPPINMPKNVAKFKKEHKNAFVKAERLYVTEKITQTAKKLVEDYVNANRQRAKDMAVIEVKVYTN
jgi:tRNA nucleotidyltransferase (CCA-adding enzyme)